MVLPGWVRLPLRRASGESECSEGGAEPSTDLLTHRLPSAPHIAQSKVVWA